MSLFQCQVCGCCEYTALVLPPIELYKPDSKDAPVSDKLLNTLGNPYSLGNAVPLIKRNEHSYTVVRVLPELTGLPVNDVTLMYMESLKPSSIRMSDGTIKCDARPGRMTVYRHVVNTETVIDSIELEVEIPLVEGFDNGHELDTALSKMRLARNLEDKEL